ncbi:MAG: UDP-4-amino-4,6-dideoxy-N-acetyl-beta-L-altrosamine transaminase [Campylobacterales bacterium]|nr:UDP-4-amino-4,6-dideoxy-N-acetyl-beta-L-altrosamine transaminase [Campylobacterales bacterium]
MIPYSTQSIGEEDIAEVVRVLRSSHLTQGEEVSRFETTLAEYVGIKHAIAFNSATSALHAAYLTAGLGEGDEIITTPISFVATCNMAVALGAKPVFCDVRLDGNIDETRIEALITPRTKAIVPVDFAGKPVAMDAIKAIARRHHLLVIDDASHALGATCKGVKVGASADMSIFSFHAIKPITTGEGGAVVTDNDTFAQKLRLIRSHGVVKKQFWNADMSTLGYNYRLTEFAAALGRSQLARLDPFVARRNAIADYYDMRFSGHKLFDTIKIPEGCTSSRHLYALLLRPELHCPKEDIFAALQQKGLGVQVHYKPIYKNSFYVKQFGEQRYPVSEDFYRSELSIPCHHGMSDAEAAYVADTVLEVIDAYSYRGCSF